MDFDFLLKIVLIGDSDVGKTNFISRFLKDEFNPYSRVTIGVEFSTKTYKVEGKIVKVQIWDTSGVERYRANTSAYYKSALGALLLYSITSSLSFKNVSLWLQELRKYAGSNITVILVGNKCDLPQFRTVSIDEGIEFSKRENLLFIEASASENVNVQEAFNILITEIIHRQLENEKTKSAPIPEPEKDRETKSPLIKSNIDKNQPDGKNNNDLDLLLSRIQFLENQLSRYEEVESFDLKNAREQKINKEQDSKKDDHLVFIDESDEEYHEII